MVTLPKLVLIMEITFKTFMLFMTIFITGLSAGFFYAWEVSVIPGTRKIIDLTYLETMQSINRAILNPAFFLVFFGSLLLLIVSTIQQYHNGLVFWVLLAATLTYFLGTFGVTALGNVPLNDSLDVLNISNLTTEQMDEFRQNYESKWNRLHGIRTCFAVLSFILSMLPLFMYSKSI